MIMRFENCSCFVTIFHYVLNDFLTIYYLFIVYTIRHTKLRYKPRKSIPKVSLSRSNIESPK